MTLVDDQQIVPREVVQQTEGALAGLPAVEVAGIVLDTRAVAELTDHLHVVGHTLVEALSLVGVSLFLQLPHPIP